MVSDVSFLVERALSLMLICYMGFIKNKCRCSFLMILFSFSCLAQEELQQAYAAQFSTEREHISVHLNKEIFTTSETIWFTAYTSISSQDAIAYESLNIQVGLYDAGGNRLESFVFYSEGGVSSGSLLLDVPAGIYFLKFQTNWMGNFEDSVPFVKKITMTNYGVPTALQEEKIKKRKKEIEQSSLLTRMTVNALPPKSIILSFKTVRENIAKRKESDFFLIFHNNENLQIAKLSLDKETVILTIPKNQLFKGVNTFLLVDTDGNEIQERLIYHTDAFDRPNPVSVLKETLGKDSVTLRLSINKELTLPKNISVSVLPMETSAVNGQADIVRQRTFKNVRIDRDKALFLPTSKRSLAALNEVLLSATNTFDWSNLQQEVKEPLLKRERGFEIMGSVNKWIDGKGEISFFQRNTGQFVTTIVGADGRFSFPNCYVEQGEKINFSVLKNGKTFSDPEITFDVFPISKRDTLNFEERFLRTLSPLDTTVANVKEPVITEASGVRLEEVQLTGNSKKKDVFEQNIELAENAFYIAKKINVKEVKKYPMLSSYIRTFGFRVATDAVKGELSILPRSFMDPPPVIFVDGFRQNEKLKDETLSSIDEIYYEKTGLNGSIGGSIYIYRKKGSFVGSDTNAVVSLPTTAGFERKRAYFNENLSDRFDIFSKKYGAVYWNGSVTVDAAGQASISFPSYGLKGVRVLIQGVDYKGAYFAKDEIVYFE